MKNGDEYAGDFLDDLFHGYSLYNYANGDTYCGDFLKGKRNGDGVLKVKSTGQNFAGRFEDDELVGGQVFCQDGEYLGTFAPKTRAFQGHGIMKFKSGDIYDGEWKDGLMHGQGCFVYGKIFADDSEEEEESKETITSMFMGQFVEGKRKQGTLTYENGDVYTGEFTEDGLRETGEIKFMNGDEFAGLFEDGAIKCGIMTFKSGDVYSGEFKDSMFDGSGKMIYANGDEFSGEFKAGAKHGSGQLVLAIKDSEAAGGDAEDRNMGIYIGEFFEDEMHGNGTFTFKDGSEYIGRFQKGLQHGQGMLILKDGT